MKICINMSCPCPIFLRSTHYVLRSCANILGEHVFPGGKSSCLVGVGMPSVADHGFCISWWWFWTSWGCNFLYPLPNCTPTNCSVAKHCSQTFMDLDHGFFFCTQQFNNSTLLLTLVVCRRHFVAVLRLCHLLKRCQTSSAQRTNINCEASARTFIYV